MNTNLNFVGSDVYHTRGEPTPQTFADWLLLFNAWLSLGTLTNPLNSAMTADEVYATVQGGVVGSLSTLSIDYKTREGEVTSALTYAIDNCDPEKDLKAILVQVSLMWAVRSATATLNDKVDYLIESRDKDLDEPIWGDVVTLPLRPNLKLTYIEATKLAGLIEPLDAYTPDLIAEWVALVNRYHQTTTAEFTAKILSYLGQGLLTASRTLSNKYSALWAEAVDTSLPETVKIDLDVAKSSFLSDGTESDALARAYGLCNGINDYAQNTGITDSTLRQGLIVSNLSLRKSLDTLIVSLDLISISDALRSGRTLGAYKSSADKATASLSNSNDILASMYGAGAMDDQKSLAIQTATMVDLSQTVLRMDDLDKHLMSSSNSASFIVSMANDKNTIDSGSKQTLSTAIRHLSDSSYQTGRDYEDVSDSQEQLHASLTTFTNHESTIDPDLQTTSYWSRLATSWIIANQAKVALESRICDLRKTLEDLTCLLNKLGVYDNLLDFVKTDEERAAENQAALAATEELASGIISEQFENGVNSGIKTASRTAVEESQAAIEAAFADNPEVYGILMEAVLASNDEVASMTPSSIMASAKDTFMGNISQVTSCVQGQVTNLFRPLAKPCSTNKGSGKGMGLNIPRRDIGFKLRVDGSSNC